MFVLDIKPLVFCRHVKEYDAQYELQAKCSMFKLDSSTMMGVSNILQLLNVTFGSLSACQMAASSCA